MWRSQRKALSWGAPRPLEREWLVGKDAEGARQPDRDFHTPVWPSGGLEQTGELPGLRDDKEHLSSTQHALQLRTTQATAAEKSHCRREAPSAHRSGHHADCLELKLPLGREVLRKPQPHQCNGMQNQDFV